jgi:phosphoribosylformylglycinamidine cyclo-ligase
MNLPLDARPTELGGQTVGAALLTPTRLYARHVQALLAAGIDVRAMSHITGGGLPGNLPRVLPEGLGLRIEHAWPRPPLLALIQHGAHVAEPEMRRTFNLGVGFVVIVPPADGPRATALLRDLDATAPPLGASPTWRPPSPIALGRVVRVPLDRAFEDRVEWPS